MSSCKRCKGEGTGLDAGGQVWTCPECLGSGKVGEAGVSDTAHDLSAVKGNCVPCSGEGSLLVAGARSTCQACQGRGSV